MSHIKTKCQSAAMRGSNMLLNEALGVIMIVTRGRSSNHKSCTAFPRSNGWHTPGQTDLGWIPCHAVVALAALCIHSLLTRGMTWTKKQTLCFLLFACVFPIFLIFQLFAFLGFTFCWFPKFLAVPSCVFPGIWLSPEMARHEL